MGVVESKKFTWITIIETASFLRESGKLFTEEEINALKGALAANPELGDVIPGLRGVRKMRWQVNQRGKQGGARIIYFFYNSNLPIFLLDAYPKSKKQDLTPPEKKTLNHLVDELIKVYGV